MLFLNSVKRGNNLKILPFNKSEFQKSYTLQSCLFVKSLSNQLSAGLNFYVSFISTVWFLKILGGFLWCCTYEIFYSQELRIVESHTCYASFSVFPKTSFIHFHVMAWYLYSMNTADRGGYIFNLSSQFTSWGMWRGKEMLYK